MNSGVVQASCQSMMLDILPSSSTYTLPAWKSGCQNLGERRSGSFGIISGIADRNFRRQDMWASGELCSIDVNSHGSLGSSFVSA